MRCHRQLETESGSGTLDQVLQVLTDLAGQRKPVGVISHVRLVQEAVLNGFCIHKDARGSRVDERMGPEFRESLEMLSNTELEKLASDVAVAVGEYGGLVIEAVVSIQGVPAVSIDGSDFLALIKHVRPRVAYVFVSKFDAEEAIFDALGGADDIVRGHRSTKKLIGAWRTRNGEIMDVSLEMMCDGVMHAALERAGWLDEFEQAAEAVTLEIDLAKGEAERREETAQREKNSTYIKKLMADPRFSSGRPSAAKRALLAKRLFPELDDGVIKAIVAEAANEIWLVNNGGTDRF
jgi:hypothetical protein